MAGSQKAIRVVIDGGRDLLDRDSLHSLLHIRGHLGGGVGLLLDAILLLGLDALASFTTELIVSVCAFGQISLLGGFDGGSHLEKRWSTGKRHDAIVLLLGDLVFR